MVRHKQPLILYSLAHSYIGDRLVNTDYDSPAQKTLSVEFALYRYFYGGVVLIEQDCTVPSTVCWW